MTDDARSFVPLDSAKQPVLPSQESVRLLIARLIAVFRKDDDTPFIADDRLQKATLEILDDVVAPPACGPLLDDIQAMLAPWIAEPSPFATVKFFVLPPCDESGIIKAWAHEHSHAVLDAPSRETLLSAKKDDALPNLAGDGLLVIPELERWFLRHRDGLTAIRALLAAIDATDRRCVIGCNSWTWEFLKKAVGAHMILPQPMTYEPFDGKRLHDWISRLAANEKSHKITFRLPQSGADVLAVNDDGERDGDYFDTLAAQSRGIPWVAWHLWRRSLRSDGEEGSEHDDDVERDADEQTLWVAALDEFTLPSPGDESPLLVLHALLLHGSMSVDELRSVLPIVGESPVVSALVSAGLTERKEGQISCRPAAYPAIRRGLSAAGFSMDRL